MEEDLAIDPMLTGVGGTRIAWSDAPLPVRSSVEASLGSSVAQAESQRHGFSPALASRLTLVDRRRVFIKAIGPDVVSGAPGGQELYRREALIAAELPADVPAPGLIGTWEVAGWVVLIFEDVGGSHPDLPWREDELVGALGGLAHLAEVLCPNPLQAPPADIPGGHIHWDRLATDPVRLERLPGLDPWIGANLDLLADIEVASGPAFHGTTLLHTDIRADNILLTADGPVFVDWPHAQVGASWIDLLWFLPSVAMQGGPDPRDVFWDHPVARGADPVSVRSVLTGIAGFFIREATQPPPPGLPALRQFQLAQGVEAIAWLRQMVG